MHYTKYNSLDVISVSKKPILDLSMVKSYLHIDYNDEDEIITDMIQAATENAEEYLGMVINPKHCVLSYNNIILNEVILPYKPLNKIVKIDSIFYSETKEISSEEYESDFMNIVKFNNKSFVHSLKINAVFGFENSKLLPAFLKQGILLNVEHLYSKTIARIGDVYKIYQPYKKVKI